MIFPDPRPLSPDSSAKHILSGIQPTGNLHLGNYLGAIRHWVALQEEGATCYYMLADLHAITLPQDPVALRRNVRECAAALVACGVDPTKSAIFPQSAVSAHAELNWILACNTPLGWLNRMTQFKDKAGKNKEKAPLGLYAYPVLMAADILLYHATHVPVGEDQKQHLELTRDIAGAFNRQYNREYFHLPEPFIMGEATRVMSLRDGAKKMSKSDESEYSRINLTDSADSIAAKFKKAKSDMHEGISFDVEKRPEASNLLTIYAALEGISVEKAAAECAALSFSDFKTRLTDVAVAHLGPISARMNELMADTAYLDKILAQGVKQARQRAGTTISEVKEIVGFLSA
ncbi:MAG: tryptophan--tRNA ligase [Alphaproteobacteria bacterium]